MAQIRWTGEAQQWLHDIFDFIAEDNPEAARKVIEGLYEKAQGLLGFPQTGHKFCDVPEGEIRILLYGHYRIAYLLKLPDTIDILGVFHGALDIDRYLP